MQIGSIITGNITIATGIIAIGLFVIVVIGGIGIGVIVGVGVIGVILGGDW